MQTFRFIKEYKFWRMENEKKKGSVFKMYKSTSLLMECQDSFMPRAANPGDRIENKS
jgi:hypothetical protein